MAIPSIRGHQGRIKIFRNGINTDIVNITKVDVNQDSSFSRSFYVGLPVAEGDQTQDGWSGSLDLEVKGPEVDVFIDALISANLAGIGVDEVTVILDEIYSNGVIQSYIYSDMQFKMSKSNGGQTEKITKRLDFQASFRTAI